LSPTTARAEALGTDLPVALIRFAGNRKTVQEQLDKTLSILKSSKDISGVRVIDDDSDIWRRLTLSDYQGAERISWRAEIPPAQLQIFLDRLSRTYNDSFGTLYWRAGIADGRIQLIEDLDSERDQVATLKDLRSHCRQLSGSLILEHAPAQMKQQFDSWGAFGPSAQVMQRIKQQLDPIGILSPGRLL
jgi:FAD/FMN-containing dehydrogenase